MSATLRPVFQAVLILTAVTLMCLAAEDCQPLIPPQSDTNATTVTLQMHQWTWVENITSPDWAPRTDSDGMVYEFLKPGVVRQERLTMLAMRREFKLVYINVTFVTNGDSLCVAALTQYRDQYFKEIQGNNITTSVNCSRICFDKFASQGTRAQLPLMVYNDWTKLRRSSEYLAFDAVNPESRAAYTCMGYFSNWDMSRLPLVMSQQKRCPEGDVCMFNYDNKYDIADGGCQSDFRQYSWCVDDLSLCKPDIVGDCPVCCRGNLCNREVAQKAYNLIKRAASSASSLWVLVLSSIGFMSLRSVA